MRTPYTIEAVTALYDADRARPHPGSVAADSSRFEAIVRGELARAASRRRRDEMDSTDSTGVEPVRAALRAGLTASTGLFRRVGLDVPALRRFAEAGVDWPALGAEYGHMRADGSSPQLVVAPVLPVRGSDGPTWQSVYAALGAGLHPGRALGVPDAARDLAAQETDRVHADLAIHEVTDPNGIVWTAALLPAADRAPEENTPFVHRAGAHAGPSQYLTLQALRLAEGRAPVDVTSWSWLEGRIGDQALAGVWVGGHEQVRLYSNPLGYAHERLGVRTPVWG